LPLQEASAPIPTLTCPDCSPAWAPWRISAEDRADIANALEELQRLRAVNVNRTHGKKLLGAAIGLEDVFATILA
jgi:hypothetical protein